MQFPTPQPTNLQLTYNEYVEIKLQYKLNQIATNRSTSMVRDHKTGGFLIDLSKMDKMQMVKKNIVAMCADFSGHFCVIRVKKGKGFKNIEQKERYLTPQEAIAAVK